MRASRIVLILLGITLAVSVFISVLGFLSITHALGPHSDPGITLNGTNQAVVPVGKKIVLTNNVRRLGQYQLWQINNTPTGVEVTDLVHNTTKVYCKHCGTQPIPIGYTSITFTSSILDDITVTWDSYYLQ